MVLSIKNSRAKKLAVEVSRETGETITQAVISALEERLERIRGSKTLPETVESIMEIARRCSSLPDLDLRSADEILDYDESGTYR